MKCCTGGTKLHRKLHYLVGDLTEYDQNICAIFELSENCSLQEEKSPTIPFANGDQQLFLCLENAPFCGRQTYKMWRASFDLMSSPFKKTDFHVPKRLHFLPLEKFHIKNAKVGGQPFVQFISEFLRTFFSGLEICFSEGYRAEGLHPVERRHQVTGRRQYLVTDLNQKLHQSTGIPKSDYILGLTWTDLYPSEDLNFVLGQASHQHKSGVFSFGRFEPKSFDVESALDENAELDLDGAVIWKMLRVATHETCHLFRLTHCVFFQCAMNASNSVTEAVMQPIFLCPICLRKLHKFLSFDIHKRYQDLMKLCQLLQEEFPSHNMGDAVQWLENCLKFLASD